MEVGSADNAGTDHPLRSIVSFSIDLSRRRSRDIGAEDLIPRMADYDCLGSVSRVWVF